MNCNFTDWYEIEKDANVLIVEKDEKNIEQYNNNKYDYIYLNGLLEYANEIIKSKNSEVELIKYFKTLLNENGTLLISVDNKNGVRNLVGNKSEHCDKIYDSLNNKFSKGKLFSKKELNEIIENSGFTNKKYYYPLPNYKVPNVIFTDKSLPDKENSKINYNVVYEDGSLVVQDEIVLLKKMIESRNFTEFTNSYIIELSNKEILNNAKYYSFNNMRKDEYSLILKMYDEYVIKYPKNEKALNHIRKIKENCNKLRELGFKIAEEECEIDVIRSKFINRELLQKYIVENIKNSKIVYEVIDKWYDEIKTKLKPDDNGIVESGFIDLVFENTFYDVEKQEYIYFDQEWYQPNIPIKYILYRAINNLYRHNSKIENVLPEAEMLQKYSLNNEVEKFKKLEDELQKTIIDEEKQKYYAKQYEYIISSEELKKIINDVKRLDKDNIELIEEIKRLEEIIKKQNEILQQIQEDKLNNNYLKKLQDKISRNKGTK